MKMTSNLTRQIQLLIHLSFCFLYQGMIVCYFLVSVLCNCKPVHVSHLGNTTGFTTQTLLALRGYQ